MPLTSIVATTINANYSKVDGLLASSGPLLKDYTKNFQTGTGAGQADLLYQKTRTLTASSSEDLDLAGVLVDNYGVTLTFARIKFIILAAADANTNNVLIGGVANGLTSFLSPAATGILTLRPGAFLALGAGQTDATGYVVTAATADLLHVANSAAGTSVTYDVIIGGCSA
jgi:hypothetical protein